MSPSILQGWLTLAYGHYLRLRYVAGEWELIPMAYVVIELGGYRGPGFRVTAWKLSVRIPSQAWSGIPHRLVHLFVDESVGLTGRCIVAASSQVVAVWELTHEDHEHS